MVAQADSSALEPSTPNGSMGAVARNCSALRRVGRDGKVESGIEAGIKADMFLFRGGAVRGFLARVCWAEDKEHV